MSFAAGGNQQFGQKCNGRGPWIELLAAAWELHGERRRCDASGKRIPVALLKEAFRKVKGLHVQSMQYSRTIWRNCLTQQ